ncbi:MAG: hypothetical protein QOE06_2305 [Thermoleophilaceae bacterium]|nr:hypothetical protein [Thermoleophilaceae bacterium]
MAAALAVAGCGSGHARVSASWHAVDSCLERRPALVGKVRGDDKDGPGGRGSLFVTVSPSRYAEAFRFRTHAAAVAGVGPRGTIAYYGPIALLVSSGSRGEEAFIKGCFARVYG